MTKAALIVMVLHLMGRHPNHRLATEIADAIASDVHTERVGARLVVKVISRESDFKPRARSACGKDLGLMQIRRGVATAGYNHLTDEQLMEPGLNIHLGIRRLRLARAQCRGEPRRWLGAYAGLKCMKTSPYARNVLSVEG